MIIKCGSCSRKFVVKDADIPREGRMVQCGYCSVSWHQMPVPLKAKIVKEINLNKTEAEGQEDLSVEKIKASDGKTYKFLGSQWAELYSSGKTGLFAKKKIGKELDKLTGRKQKNIIQKKQKKTKKELNPSSVSLNDEKKLPDIYKPKEGLGFFGYIFLIIIITISSVGVLKTFENDLLDTFAEAEYIFQFLDEQLIYISETVKNITVIINDLISSY